eukprot:1503651-Amphidinium_carterae.1
MEWGLLTSCKCRGMRTQAPFEECPVCPSLLFLSRCAKKTISCRSVFMLLVNGWVLSGSKNLKQVHPQSPPHHSPNRLVREGAGHSPPWHLGLQRRRRHVICRAIELFSIGAAISSHPTETRDVSYAHHTLGDALKRTKAKWTR